MRFVTLSNFDTLKMVFAFGYRNLIFSMQERKIVQIKQLRSISGNQINLRIRQASSVSFELIDICEIETQWYSILSLFSL
jgi:hypothetical protein